MTTGSKRGEVVAPPKEAKLKKRSSSPTPHYRKPTLTWCHVICTYDQKFHPPPPPPPTAQKRRPIFNKPLAPGAKPLPPPSSTNQPRHPGTQYASFKKHRTIAPACSRPATTARKPRALILGTTSDHATMISTSKTSTLKNKSTPALGKTTTRSETHPHAQPKETKRREKKDMKVTFVVDEAAPSLTIDSFDEEDLPSPPKAAFEVEQKHEVTNPTSPLSPPNPIEDSDSNSEKKDSGIDASKPSDIPEEIEIVAKVKVAEESQQPNANVIRNVDESSSTKTQRITFKERMSGKMKKEAIGGNDVIEETTRKLAEERRNKVKALVGAFETVLSFNEPESQQTSSQPRQCQRRSQQHCRQNYQEKIENSHL